MVSALLRLRELVSSMSGAERLIAEYLLDRPEEAMELSIHKLAEKTFSSPSTIVRMCNRIGFSGYREFRRSVIYEMALRNRVRDEEYKDITQLDSVEEIIEKITYKNITTLEDSRKLLDGEILARCVELLCRCERVLLYGMGASLLVAQDAYLKFLRINKPCAISSDWHAQLLTARNATPEDCAIVISYSGETEEVVACMKALRENSTPIIAITRCSDSTVVGLSDYTLYTAANETIFRSGAMASRISQLNTIDILYTAFANVDYEKNIRQFSRSHIYKPGVKVKVDGGEEG